MVYDCGQHHALVGTSFIPSPRGDRAPGAASPRGAVILMRGAPPPVRRREMLAACGCPPVRQAGAAGPLPQTHSLAATARACISGRTWHVGEVVYLWECGLG